MENSWEREQTNKQTLPQEKTSIEKKKRCRMTSMRYGKIRKKSLRVGR